MIGKEIGKYRVTEQIGEGGMGCVYKATHSLIGRHAAIKVLLPELSHNQEIVNRFFNEAKASTAIHHPGIVEIFDFGYLDTGAAYIVMEFLHGEPLTNRMKRKGKLTPQDALSILRQMAGALSAAHNLGIIHRDLKPDNVFLVHDPEVTGGERIKILDFGIAKLSDDGSPASIKTRTGAVMGTPSYMAPEQCRGAGDVDPRSDLYSLGCMLFEMLTGRLVFPGEGAGEVLAAHIHVAPESPRTIEPSIPMPVEALIMRLLAKNPHDRPASAIELIKEIDQLGYSAFRAATSHPMPVATAPTMSGNHTTLGGAAGQSMHPNATVPPQKKGGKWILPALGGLVVAGGAAAALLLMGGSKDKQDQPDKPPPTLAAKDGPKDPKNLPTTNIPTPKKDDPTRSGLNPTAKKPTTPTKPGGLLSKGTLKLPKITPQGGTTPPTTNPTAPPVKPPVVAPPVTPPTTPKVTPPAEITVVITSVPTGAFVHQGRRALGKTPYTHRFTPTKGALKLQVKKNGYRTAELSLPGDKAGAKKVRLKKIRRGGNNSGRYSSTGTVDDDD